MRSARSIEAAPAGRLLSLEMLRAIAALLVLLFHTQSIWGKRTGLDVFAGLFASGNRGVDLFFVLSGFIIASVHGRDFGRPARLGAYLASRAGRIFPAVWIMSGFALLTYGAAVALGVSFGFGGGGGTAQAGYLGLWNILASVLLLPQDGPPLVNVTWTLKYELMFYVLFALPILDRRFVLLLGLWQAAVLACLLAGVAPETGWEQYLLGPMCLEFGIGLLCAWLVFRRGAWAVLTGRVLPGAALALGGVLFVGAMLCETYWVVLPPWLGLLAYGLGGGAVVSALALLDLAGRVRPVTLLVALGEASYAIYIVHFSVITLLSWALLRLRLPPTTGLFLLTALAGVLAGVAFHRLVDRPIQRGLRRWRLGRGGGIGVTGVGQATSR